jgi:hypothetical protein
MSKVVEDFEDQISELNAKTNAKGERLAVVDPQYRNDLFKLQVGLSKAKALENMPSRIGEENTHGVNTYDRTRNHPGVVALQGALGAKNPKTGARWVTEKPALRAEIERGLGNVMHGQRFTMSPDLSAIVNSPK